jgi:hypothetical protein
MDFIFTKGKRLEVEKMKGKDIDYLSVHEWLKAEVSAMLDGELEPWLQKAFGKLSQRDWDRLLEEFVNFWETEYREELVEYLKEGLEEIAEEKGIEPDEEEDEE